MKVKNRLNFFIRYLQDILAILPERNKGTSALASTEDDIGIYEDIMHNDTYKLIWDEEHALFEFGTVKFNLDNNLNVSGMTFDVPNDDIFFEEIKAKKLTEDN